MTEKNPVAEAFPNIDAWRMLALITQAAQEVGIEPERAFRFMAAIVLLMTAEARATKGPGGAQ